MQVSDQAGKAPESGEGCGSLIGAPAMDETDPHWRPLTGNDRPGPESNNVVFQTNY